MAISKTHARNTYYKSVNDVKPIQEINILYKYKKYIKYAQFIVIIRSKILYKSGIQLSKHESIWLNVVLSRNQDMGLVPYVVWAAVPKTFSI